MNLEKQLEILTKEAPQYGVSSEVMEKAVIPVLKFFASQHQNTDYFVLQSRDRQWVVTTLQNREQPQLSKRVIYGFATRKDATSFQGIVNPNIVAVSLPITHLLFQMFALSQVDSLILMDIPNNTMDGMEIERANLENMIQQQLRRAKLELPSQFKGRKIPPNLA
ncbi:conserved hypothetical protein [Rippkaea orientalis PCC 8801]|uniref:Uncharacterized protein n=1 Tax=Rippkaea orientalis (strain PCC 8801 / RF-1) TaxID=41431 RepID=B7K3P6_RIPO1|nr:hypothetical protein [Rippkaea orientalis]ACK65388.1 conserved hypothetical protein [Rippkaea orientalis PCC 8801]